jgi:RNase H-like domain found in reverse transcriptase/Integrase zinc binding domain/Reverse transcriptase (RNA-dependent DNA polymerase)
MGVKQSPDIAQEIIKDLFRDVDEVDSYIDDVGCFNDSWEDHLQSLTKVLTILEENNFIVNPFKCEWGVQETDWLGYWLTPTGLKPWKKKIQAILALQPPTTPTQLRSFLGAVNFYCDMYPRRSHVLAPLTAQSGAKEKINWTPECQKAFEQMKAIMAEDAFLRYPNHNKPFHIYADASDTQLGAAIIQDNAPVAFYSRKLNSAQKNYTTGEKEILSIVETLREFHTLLYGSKEIHVYKVHKNNTFTKQTNQHVLRWALFLEDYGITWHYIKGESNTLADALSRLPFDERQNPVTVSPQPFFDHDQPSLVLGHDNNVTDIESYYSMAINDDNLLDCFINLPESEGVPFIPDYATIANAQTWDAELLQKANEQPQKYVQQILAPGTSVYCYIREPNAPWKIYIPQELVSDAPRWYHLALGHIGARRLLDTMQMHFYAPGLQQHVENITGSCDVCQRMKQPS